MGCPPLRVILVQDGRWESGKISIPSGRHRPVVILAYPDVPAALLQNDVNLVVQAGDEERHGNMGTGE